MNSEYEKIVDRLLDMNPDPIPKFILLKEFKGYGANNSEYDDLYEKVCAHPHVKKREESQNDRGFWHPFHGLTEGIIRLLLSYGLDKNNPLLNKVEQCLVRLLQGNEITGQHEKQDNPLWYPVMFESIIFASMLSLIDSQNGILTEQRKIWSNFAEISFSKGAYDRTLDDKAQFEHFGFKTKRIVEPFNYYNLLLLAPNGNTTYISDRTDQALVDYCMNEANGIYYVYNNKLNEFVVINAQNKGSRDFWHWIRALSLISQFKGWAKYEQKYTNWIWEQRNPDGFWEFPGKFDFNLSNSWRSKNKVIDSTIFVLRFLMGKKAF